MGRTVTPKLKLEIKTSNPNRSYSLMAWKYRANELTLRAWVVSYNESLKPGEVNAHLTKGSTIEAERITWARISENTGYDGATVLEMRF